MDFKTINDVELVSKLILTLYQPSLLFIKQNIQVESLFGFKI
jgi:hypothetical protein